MSFTYDQKKNRDSVKNGAKLSVISGKESFIPNSTRLSELGHRVDMPVVMREKMEDSFGMDLSAVKLYENRAVGEAGAEAVTKGSNIAFAPGKLDFSSSKGQALLGHEISHVASQARGEVRGSGFLNDSSLEARADREGLKAARGESIAAGYWRCGHATVKRLRRIRGRPDAGKKRQEECRRIKLQSYNTRQSKSGNGEYEPLFFQ